MRTPLLAHACGQPPAAPSFKEPWAYDRYLNTGMEAETAGVACGPAESMFCKEVEQQ